MESSVNARLPEMTGHSILYSKWHGFRGEMENNSRVCGVTQTYGLNYKEFTGSREANRQFICRHHTADTPYKLKKLTFNPIFIITVNA